MEIPVIGYIDGDTRLVSVNPTTSFNRLLSTAAARHLDIRSSPLFALFFSDQNIQYLRRQIERVLENLTGETFLVPANAEFAQAMISLAESNTGLANNPTFLRQLNYKFVMDEANVQFASYRQKFLYHKYILENNRIKFMPYGQNDLQVKGELAVSHSGYSLTHPSKRYRDDYLHATAGLSYCPSNSTYKRNPNYLKPIILKKNSQPSDSVASSVNSCCR